MSNATATSRSEFTLKPRSRLGKTTYRDEGRGEIVFLIHGVGLNADAWEPQIAALSTKYRVVAMDMAGHGGSDCPSADVKLDYYVQQVAELMAALDISAANIIGHSMGGLVAIGFALAHPEKTLRLVVLNSVYKRTSEKRMAVLKRAIEVNSLGTVGDVEGPLERWFGERQQQPAVAQHVRDWLNSADPLGYAKAYRIFAESDEVFVGRLHELAMPALFATGSLDLNSSPETTEAMAREARYGRALILENERHMMNLTNSQTVNTAILGFLKENASVFDPKDLRKAFGTFMTGVTVVTTCEANGSLRGFTANSFSSVSLDPPLLLVSISKAAASCDVFAKAHNFAVNILSDNQKDISGIFASKQVDKFETVKWSKGDLGNPLIDGAAAWFDCARHDVIDTGDHIILIGRVAAYAHTDANALGYARGGYFSLGLEQSAVNAVSQAGRTEVGAILECEGRLIVVPGSKHGTLSLPYVGEPKRAGSASQLIKDLEGKGIHAKLGFLFAVFENPEAHTQSIFYRGEAKSDKPTQTVGFDDVPWDKFEDEAIRLMLRRYCTERQQGRYRIYSGDHLSGETKELNE